jgi:integrase
MNEVSLLEEKSIQPMITIAMDENPAPVYLARLTTENSRYGMRWCLSLGAEILSSGKYDCFELDWTKMKYQHFVALKSKLVSPNPTPRSKKPYSVGTTNMILSGVKGIIREAWKMGLVSDPDYLRISSESNVRGESLPAGRAITTNEVKRLFDIGRKNGGANGTRDSAILAVLLGAGLKRSEVADLDLNDWLVEDKLIIVQRGKGMKAREIPISTQVNSAIAAWVHLRGRDEGPLFTMVHHRNQIHIRRLDPSAIYGVLERRCLQAGVENVSPHDCRRTYITNLLSNGNDLASVAKLAGHKSVETTAIYDRRGLESLRQAAESLELPIF